MRLCCADGRTSTEPIGSTVSRIACWTICLDGVAEMEDRHGEHLDARRGSNSHVAECGPGDHEHTRYDKNVTDLAVDFLSEKAASPDDKPFLLYCGFMHPHFPLIAPLSSSHSMTRTHSNYLLHGTNRLRISTSRSSNTTVGRGGTTSRRLKPLSVVH